MIEFWYWWDRNVIGKPFWSTMGKVYALILGCGVVAYIITSLIRGSWSGSIFGIFTGAMFLIILANLGVGMVNIKMASKYRDEDWDFSRNRR